MFEFIAQNWATIVVGIAVAAAVTAIVIKLIRDKKNHKGGCSCGCSGCPHSNMCHK